jgi:hypothetical protein
MYFARVILAALIAVSVATVPTTGSAGISVAPTAMSMANQTDMPCCPSPDDRKDIACAFKCLNFVAALFPVPVGIEQVTDALPSLLGDVTLQGHVTPPTHPPPI